MKNRFTAMILAIVLVLGLAACGQKTDAPIVEGTPEQIIEKIYENFQVDLPLISREIDLTDENECAYNLGLANGEKLSAAAISEPMMGQAYSLVVARVKNAGDAAQVAKEMYEKIDTRKWICVEADTKTAAYCGDVVLFFMVNSEFTSAENGLAAFQKVCGDQAKAVG